MEKDQKKASLLGRCPQTTAFLKVPEIERESELMSEQLSRYYYTPQTRIDAKTDLRDFLLTLAHYQEPDERDYLKTKAQSSISPKEQESTASSFFAKEEEKEEKENEKEKVSEAKVADKVPPPAVPPKLEIVLPEDDDREKVLSQEEALAAAERSYLSQRVPPLAEVARLSSLADLSSSRFQSRRVKRTDDLYQLHSRKSNILGEPEPSDRSNVFNRDRAADDTILTSSVFLQYQATPTTLDYSFEK